MKLDRILVVDDSEPDNVYHEIVLRRAGFEGDLRVMNDPNQALEYLRDLPDGPVCLVLLDINMPGLDGWQFIAQAQGLLTYRPTLLLVMLTSSPAPEDRNRARELLPVRGYMTKPLTVENAARMLAGNWPQA